MLIFFFRLNVCSIICSNIDGKNLIFVFPPFLKFIRECNSVRYSRPIVLFFEKERHNDAVSIDEVCINVCVVFVEVKETDMLEIDGKKPFMLIVVDMHLIPVLSIHVRKKAQKE